MARRAVVEVSNDERYETLKRQLQDKRRELLTDVQGRVKEVRTAKAENQGIRETRLVEESAGADMELLLIELNTGELRRIDDALARLNEGSYGRCQECGDEISPQRLRARMFAVRCKDCEEAVEIAIQREWEMKPASSRGPRPLFN